MKLYLLPVAALLLGGASHVAASSTSLSVSGNIIPEACEPTLPNNGTADLGKISIKDLNPGTTRLPDVELALKVSCSAKMLMAVKVTDNRQGTAYFSSPSNPTPSIFGMGLASNGAKIGFYMLQLNDALADGAASGLIESVDGKVWFPAWGTVWQPGWMRSPSDSAGSDPSPLPKPVQNFSATLIVQPTIGPPKSLPSGEDIGINGLATLDVMYP